MKLVRSLLLTGLMVLTAALTAFASPEAPTDQEVIQAFQQANTVYEWFEHHPLRTDGKGERDTGYMIYYTVADKAYPNMMALKAKVNEHFTEALASFIISDSRMYREFDGKLYVAPAPGATDPHKGPAPSTSSGCPPPKSTWRSAPPSWKIRPICLSFHWEEGSIKRI